MSVSGHWASLATARLPRPRGRGKGLGLIARPGATDEPSGGVADRPDEAKTMFRAAPVTVPSWGVGPDAGWLGELLARRDGLTRGLVTL